MGDMRLGVELENAVVGRRRSRNLGAAADVVEHLGLEKSGNAVRYLRRRASRTARLWTVRCGDPGGA